MEAQLELIQQAILFIRVHKVVGTVFGTNDEELSKHGHPIPLPGGLGECGLKVAIPYQHVSRYPQHIWAEAYYAITMEALERNSKDIE